MGLFRSGSAVQGGIVPDVAALLNRSLSIVATAAVLSMAAPPTLAQSSASPAGAPAGTEASAAAATLPQRIEQALHAQPDRSTESDVVRLFYYSRAYRPVGYGSARSGEVIAAARASSQHGLMPADFAIDALREAAASGSDDPDAIVRRELLFTDAVARLARQTYYGKVDPAALYPTWNFAPIAGVRERARMLAALLDADSISMALAVLAPQDDAYRGLQKALSRYSELAAKGSWPRLPDGPTLRPGQRDARVRTLRQRLQAEGWIAAGDKGAARGDPASYDRALAAAVERFQQAHGLPADAAVGSGTLAALNVSAAERVAQIRVNLERLRWLARDTTADRLVVNIAGFNAELLINGASRWSSKVVVGRPTRETPVLLDHVQHLVLNPKWVVPPTVLREDIIPKAAGNPAYLDKLRMRVIDGRGQPVAPTTIDWSEARRTGFPYQLVQQSGADGALGYLKFSLSNGYSIYLHDTPSRGQFRKPVRALSSGCVRLEKPRDLALLLLDDPRLWSAEALDAAIASGRTQTVAVDRQVPVMLLYRTAVADATGAVSFRSDIYNHDGAVLALLDATTPPRH